MTVHWKGPFCHARGMPGQALSDAVIAYVWGDRSAPWPSERPEALTDEQQAFLPDIRSLIELVFADPPTEPTLDDMAERVESSVRTARPELTDKAVQALSNLYCFTWK